LNFIDFFSRTAQAVFRIDMMEIYSVKEACSYLKVSIHTLNKWRSEKKGPPYIKMGRYVKYNRESLDRFLKNHEIDPTA
jgi:excisionase family DNA binding protein